MSFALIRTTIRDSGTGALLRAHVNGTEIVLKSMYRRSNLSLFLYVQGLIDGCLTVFI